jgi:quinol monooxygenase YgiN
VPDAKLLTVIEARVPKERWDELRAAYEALAGANPPERLGGYLAQSADDPEVWHGISVWRSAAALDAYRARVPVPAGLAVFRAVASDVKLKRYAISAED